MAKSLTAKQRSAAEHFVLNGVKNAAYEQAYSCGRMKQATIDRRATDLFQLDYVAAYVTERQQKAVDLANATTEHVEINAAWVLKRAALLANFNINRFITTQSDGTAVYDFSQATDDDWYCIDEYTVDTISKGSGPDKYIVDRVKLKTSAKLRALELVGKHVQVQAFKENVEHSGVITTETYELSNTERSARIAALLDRGRARRDGQADN